MITEDIGAFEAKTHFSRILREVTKGKEFNITLRGKTVAVIKKNDEDKKTKARRALLNLSQFRRPLSMEEIESLKNADREY